MRTVLIFLTIAGLGAAFLIQKRSDRAATAAKPAPVREASPRQTSEHDWAKRSLETTNSVIRKVQQQRKDDDLSDAVGRRQ